MKRRGQGSKMRKILAVMLSVAMIFVMTACAGDSTEENGDGNQDLTEYRFSSTYVLVLRDKDEEDILNYDQAVEDVFGIDAQYGQEAHLEDNFLFIKATVEQKNALIDHNDELLKQFSEQLSQKNEAYKVEYSKDYSAMKSIWIMKNLKRLFRRRNVRFRTGYNVSNKSGTSQQSALQRG